MRDEDGVVCEWVTRRFPCPGACHGRYNCAWLRPGDREVANHSVNASPMRFQFTVSQPTVTHTRGEDRDRPRRRRNWLEKVPEAAIGAMIGQAIRELWAVAKEHLPAFGEWVGKVLDWMASTPESCVGKKCPAPPPRG